MILLLSSLPQKSGCLAEQMRKTPDHGWIPKNMYLSTRFKEIQAAQIPCICVLYTATFCKKKVCRN